MGRREPVVLTSWLLLGAGVLLLGDRAYLRAKGAVAEVLIERACAAHLQDGQVHRPWSWADMSPVAQLEVPRIGVIRPILSGASGSTLAFGLGHLSGTVLPGQPGNCAVAGHRDTWAALLRDLRMGDEVRLRSARGSTSYRVTSTRVVREDRIDVLAPTEGSRLTLITCYPFSGLLRSPWRYVVTAEKASETLSGNGASGRGGVEWPRDRLYSTGALAGLPTGPLRARESEVPCDSRVLLSGRRSPLPPAPPERSRPMS